MLSYLMSYLAAVEVAIVVTVLLTKQAVRLLKKENEEKCVSCEMCLSLRSVLSDCSGVTRWLLVRDEMGMMS